MSERKPRLNLSPRKSKTVVGDDSWWYENKASISVIIRVTPGTTTGQADIARSQIESWLKKLK